MLRYRTEDTGEVDGLRGHEGAFLACSFWMADCLYLIGRYDDAHAMLDRLIGLRNDLGLLAEEYDVRAKRQVGNFPQAFSHVSLVNAAYNLSGHASMEEQVLVDENLLRRAGRASDVPRSCTDWPRRVRTRATPSRRSGRSSARRSPGDPSADSTEKPVSRPRKR